MLSFLSLTLILALGFDFVHAQDLSVPSSWTNTSSHYSRDDRIILAQRALGRVKEGYQSSGGGFTDMSYWQVPQILASFAFKDYIANTTDNRFVVDALTQAARDHEGFSGMPFYALACIYAYRAYNDQSMLQLADTVWSGTMDYVISADQAKDGKHPSKAPTFASSCDGASVEGGVFYSASNKTDMRLTTITTGNFVTLSAHLAELTSSQKYKDAAIASARFMKAHMLDNDLVVDYVLPGPDGCSVDSGTRQTSNSGSLIEGFSVLADVTGNDAWRNQVQSTIIAAVHTTQWADSDGIVREGLKSNGNADANSYKSLYLKGFYEPWSRNPGNKDLQELISSYVNVQYNALLQWGTTSGSNLYASNWHAGPPPTSLTPDGIMSSLNLLAVGAVGADDQPQASPTKSAGASSTGSAGGAPVSTGTVPASSTPSPKKDTNVGAIAGGAAAGVLALVALLLALWCLRRRRRRSLDPRASFLPRESDEDKFMIVPGPREPGGGGPLSLPQMPTLAGTQYATSQNAMEASWRAQPSPSIEPPSTAPSASGSSGSRAPQTALTWQGQQPASYTTPATSAPPVSAAVIQPRQRITAKDEKRALRTVMMPQNIAEGERLGPASTAASSSTPSSPVQATKGQLSSGALLQPGNEGGYENLPTTELVKILNKRLQAGAGEVEENPPMYMERS